VKQKKEKEEKKVIAAASGKEEGGVVEDPSLLDLRVGLVLKCWVHESAEKLLCEEIDIGETSPRTIASGIRAHYKPDDVQGRKVLVVANLKERSLAGFKSQGMVMCACNDDHSVVQLLTIPDAVKVGDRVTFCGFNSEPASASQVAKKKILETLGAHFRTDSEGVCKWKNIAFKIGDQSIRGLPNSVVS